MRNRMSLHLRRLIHLRCFSNSLTRHRLIYPPLPPPFPLSEHLSSTARFQCFSIRNFCSQPENTVPDSEEEISIAKLFSDELRKNPDSEPLPLPKRLHLSFSHVKISPALLLSTLNISPDAGRAALDFLKWAKSRPGFDADDEVYSYFVQYFGRRKDFKATHEILVDGSGVAGIKSLEALVDRLIRAGRPTQAVELFEKMEKDYGFVRSMDSLKLIVSGLCDRGYASYAEKMVKSLANEFFPDEYICDALINGWCGKEQRKAARETSALEEAKIKLEKLVDELRSQLQMERCLRVSLEKKLEQSMDVVQSQGEITNNVLEKEAAHIASDAARIAIDEAFSMMKEKGDPVEENSRVSEDAEETEDSGTTEDSSAVKRLKGLLKSEKQRADDLERRYGQAMESAKRERKKLEEIDRRVNLLQESLNRMIYRISGQFSELKMILSATSDSSSSTGVLTKDDRGDESSTSSDTTSSDSDFTFPAPTSNSADVPPLDAAGTLQLIVQDLSAAEVSGTEKRKNGREGAFDDFF